MMTMISEKNNKLVNMFVTRIQKDGLKNVNYAGIKRSLLLEMSDKLDAAMRPMGYTWDDVCRAMNGDHEYICTTKDDMNRKIDRVIRDYRTRCPPRRDPQANGSEGQPSPTPFPFDVPDLSEHQPEQSDPEQDRDDGPETPDGPEEDDPDDDSEDDPQDDRDGCSDEDDDPEECSDDDPNDPDDPDDDPDGDGGDDDPEQDPDPDPDDPMLDLLERIVRHNLEHPDRVVNVLLHGPRGTAKTRMGIEVSYRVFGEPPSIMTAPQDKYEIIGYADSLGNPVPTTFIKGYTRPGILLIDEVDRMDQTAGIAMNSAISNGLLDTTYMGVLERDPGMTVIATANTVGTGADDEYVTANVMDASIRDRFAFIPVRWDHDKALEISHGDLSLVDFIERWNRACDSSGLGVASASYRALLMWDTFRDMGLPDRDILEYVLLKGALDDGDLLTIRDAMVHSHSRIDHLLSERTSEAERRLGSR